ncbi:hypothetical protein [Taklimakanibacter albus]|uniref:Uncharacterized protein n=1 Tax=Taklimakanibacter albus TaxID=2800327 RepID=A0ACC5QXU1_9HYPH|nr:hypothetical protein [Aestuariivirga sp. YIM B02566]MBK1865201.1 hypothetical protein [Aestuariivirga sp. YIM B02566]
MPATSQAMPVGPAKAQTAQDGNFVLANHKKKWRREHRRWRGERRWRESRRWRGDRWNHHRKWRRHRYYDPYYYDPYYYGGYYGPGYGYYGPGYWGGPGIGLQFRID